MSKTIICVLDMQRIDANFPLKAIYEKVVDSYQRNYIQMKALPIIKRLQKKHKVIVLCLDHATEQLLEENNIKYKDFKDVTENIWEFRKGKRAVNAIKEFDKVLKKHNIPTIHNRINLIDMVLKDIWKSHFLPITSFIDKADSLVNTKSDAEIAVFNNSSRYQRLLMEVGRKHKLRIRDYTIRPGKTRLRAELIRRAAKLNLPKYLREIRVAENYDIGKNDGVNAGRHDILITDRGVVESKVNGWARHLKKKIFVGERQEQFKDMDYKHISIYIDEIVAKALKQLQEKWSGIRMSKNCRQDLKYKGVNYHAGIMDLVEFLFNARFYEAAANIEIIKAMFRKERPKVIVTIDDVSTYGKSLVAVAKQKKIPISIVEHGYLQKIAVYERSSADLHLVWGEQAKDVLKSIGVPENNIKITGRAESIAKNTQKVPYKNYMLFTSQGISDAYNIPVFDCVYKAMSLLPKKKFITKLHPDETGKLHHAFIKKHQVKNCKMIKHGELGLDALISNSKGIINFYSAVFMEALRAGKPVISVNATGYPEEVFPEQKNDATITVKNAEQTVNALRKLWMRSDEKTIKELAQFYIVQEGEKACRQTAREIIKLTKKG